MVKPLGDGRTATARGVVLKVNSSRMIMTNDLLLLHTFDVWKSTWILSTWILYYTDFWHMESNQKVQPNGLDFNPIHRYKPLAGYESSGVTQTTTTAALDQLYRHFRVFRPWDREGRRGTSRQNPDFLVSRFTGTPQEYLYGSAALSDPLVRLTCAAL